MTAAPANGSVQPGPDVVLQSTLPRTPQTTLELANMLRDPMSRERCPFGVDFEEQTVGQIGRPGNRSARMIVPWWLALMELYGEGFRYGSASDRELPYRFDLVVAAITQRRAAWQAAPGGAAEHSLIIPADLAQALVANPVFRHKVAAHDLSKYALSAEEGRLREITNEQLQHGGIMATTSILPLAAAESVASAFFDFAMKHRLADTMTTMTSEQIQVISLFHSSLLQRPVKRVVVSERLDLVQRKPAYVPACAIASPEVPHFVRVACNPNAGEDDGAAEHAPVQPAVLQAPVICQLCGAGFLKPEGLWRHAAAAHHSWAEYRKRLIFET